jgi:5-methylcytosine-specific restriction enzyme A
MPRKEQNPPWQRDELILLLDLYVRHRPGIIPKNHPEVAALSRILNRLPIHAYRPDKSRFRNSNGVQMELANFLALDPDYPGKGLQKVGKLQQLVWDEFSAKRQELAKIAIAIKTEYRAVVDDGSRFATDSEEEEEQFPEGRILYRLHRARERNRALIERAKAKALREKGRLACAACGFDFANAYGLLGDGFIECHHLLPLSQLRGAKNTRLSELALVCANCHRMLHRRRPWLSFVELKRLLVEPK